MKQLHVLIADDHPLVLEAMVFPTERHRRYSHDRNSFERKRSVGTSY